MQAISLDFLGVPGSALGCKTLELLKVSLTGIELLRFNSSTVCWLICHHCDCRAVIMPTTPTIA